MDITLNNGTVARNVTPSELQELDRLGYIGHATASNCTVQQALPENIGEIETMVINKCLEQAGGNITRAAKMAGISRATMYRKMKIERKVVPKARNHGKAGNTARKSI